MDVSIRAYDASDLDFFKLMFYESLFVPPGQDAFPASIIDKPHLSRYYTDWGRTGDCCHIVEVEGKRVGAIWSRYFTAEHPGYGYVADDMSEFGIALLPEWTAKGIGSRVMNHHFNIIRNQDDCSGVSLSADIRNRAVKLYERYGFQEVSRDGESIVMMLKF